MRSFVVRVTPFTGLALLHFPAPSELTMISRTPDEVAEYVARHRIGTGGAIIDGNSIRVRLTQDKQDRLDAIIHRESGTYDLEQIRQIGCGND